LFSVPPFQTVSPGSSTVPAPPASSAPIIAAGSLPPPQPSLGVPITHISFPPSPSPVPSMSTIL
jgi:hypothetical protein